MVGGHAQSRYHRCRLRSSRASSRLACGGVHEQSHVRTECQHPGSTRFMIQAWSRHDGSEHAGPSACTYSQALQEACGGNQHLIWQQQVHDQCITGAWDRSMCSAPSACTAVAHVLTGLSGQSAGSTQQEASQRSCCHSHCCRQHCPGQWHSTAAITGY